MKFDSLAPDLQSWFRDMIKRGTDRDALLKSLLGAGYQERYARDAIDAALKALPKPPPPPPVQPTAAPVAASDPGRGRHGADAQPATGADAEHDRHRAIARSTCCSR